MTPRSSESLAAARWLVGVITSVVVAFIIATMVSLHIDSATESRTNDIIGNAMPSIQTLSFTRTDLRRLENEIERYASLAPSERDDLGDRINTQREYIRANLALYSALPFFPEEPPLADRAQAEFEELKAQIGSFLANPDPGEIRRIHRQVDVFDEAIEKIITFDATQGQRLSHDIERIRGRTRATAVLLDALGVVLAVIAAILAVRQLRRVGRDHAAELDAHEKRESELASQNEALGQFAGRVAHDILSPLSAAALTFELVRQTHAEDLALQRTMDRGAAAVIRVHTLVDGLLAFAHAGGRPEPGVSTELRSVITDVVDELRLQARQQDIVVDLGAIPDGSIACSSGVLTSLISNLGRNAIKYMNHTEERRIEVRVRNAESRWRVEVEDTGPGIPIPQQQRIFEPYVQLNRRASGIGLGLATVDRLVRAHSGSVGVVSPVRGGHGTMFWFELPKQLARPAVEKANEQDAS